MTEAQVEAASHGSLTEEQWDDLLRSIKAGHCTPIVGAGACHPTLPLAGALAERLAEQHRYPLTDRSNLARVTQYLAIRRFGLFPKEEVLGEIAACGYPDFDAEDDPHRVLAELPLPIFVTTNYDDFLESALRHRLRRAEVDYYRWNDYDEITGTRSIFRTGYQPDPDHPLVYHLHGHSGVPQSIVLTEQDYLDFLLKAKSKGVRLLPPPVRIALSSHALLFVGYSLNDWTFRVLFRSLMEMIRANNQRPAVSIQLPPTDVMPGHEADARRYLNEYHRALQGIEVRMYWGSARQFASDLRARWEAFR